MGSRQRRARSSAKTHATPVILTSVLGFFLIAGIAFGIGMIGNVSRWLSDLPDYTNADEYLVSEPTHILDAAGNEIATFFVQNRQSITMDQVSPWVVQGTVDVEDERFYEHPGVDIIGIGRAVVAQLTGRSEGASTITQQLVRNTILSEEQFDITIERKVREAWIALEMEKIYSKDEILMMYLNTIYYGHGAYGIQAACRTYLSKNASELTLAEAALMIGLPNSPSYYDPTVNPDIAVDRRNKVLGNMLRLGTITQEEHDAAVAEPLTLNVTETSSTGVTVYSQPYFIDYVKTLLQEEFSTDVLFKGGLTIKTSLDPNVQAVAEKSAIDNINRFPVANRDGLDLDVGMTVIDPKTGYIKAMVGGRDYNRVDQNANGEDVTLHINHALEPRQPGSSFKAFTLATAINMGMNPNVTINCGSPFTWEIPGQEPYRGQNYGNESMGYISLARATEKSSNTGYIQVAEAVGNQNILETCSKLGINTSLIPDVLTMTLGVGQVSTLDMAGAYAAFANGGNYREPTAITEILSREGEVLYQHKDAPEQVFSAGVASEITRVLSGVLTNGTGVWGRPNINQPVAGKTGTTGTSDEANDLWFCGYTPQYSVAIWVGGYKNVGSIGYFDGTHLTLPVFKTMMEQLLGNVAREEFPTGDLPAYKNNNEWKFSKTNVNPPKPNRPSAPPKQDEDKDKEEEPETPETPSTPEPTPEPETPETPFTPEPETPETPSTPEPETPTTPDTGGGSTGGGSTGGGSTTPPTTPPTTPAE